MANITISKVFQLQIPMDYSRLMTTLHSRKDLTTRNQTEEFRNLVLIFLVVLKKFRTLQEFHHGENMTWSHEEVNVPDDVRVTIFVQSEKCPKQIQLKEDV